jgi:hypothetical protein
MKLPDIPAPGEPIPASWGKEVVEYLRSLTPVASPTVLPQQTPNGTSFTALPPRRRPSADVRSRDRAFARGKAWPRSSWGGTPSRWLIVYADGVTAPAFTTKATFDAWCAGTLELDNAEIFDLEADDIHAWMH